MEKVLNNGFKNLDLGNILQWVNTYTYDFSTHIGKWKHIGLNYTNSSHSSTT